MLKEYIESDMPSGITKYSPTLRRVRSPVGISGHSADSHSKKWFYMLRNMHIYISTDGTYIKVPIWTNYPRMAHPR
jgi:hypothetical protein